MSMAFRGQPQYAQSPTGGYNMSGYGGDAMQALGDIGDIGGFGGFGALSGPATMGGNYSMFGSYNPMPYQQQSYTGGYVPGYGAQLPQQFGGYGGYGGYGGFGGGFGGYGGGYGGFGMPQQPQQNVNDLFGQYMFGQYYGQPAFNPFQATSMFGGGRRGGGFGGARQGSRQQFQQQPPVSLPRQPNFGRFGQTSQPAPTPTPTPAPAVPDKNQDPEYWYSVFKENNPGIDDARARELATSRAAAFRGQGTASQPAAPAQPATPAAPAGLYDTSNDDWGRGEGPIDASQLPSGFNWKAYLDAPSNADLRAAGVDTPSEAARHYLKYGRGENRSLGGAPAAAQSTPDVTQPAVTGYEYTQPYSFGPVDMGGLPMFVDNYAGLYPNRFSMF